MTRSLTRFVPRAAIFVGAAILVGAAMLFGCTSATKAGAVSPDDSTGETTGRGIEDFFVGRFPGVEVARDPSGGITVRIRGASTILGSSEPLYIIDGARVQSGPGGLLFLDPGDIKKIEVLKDIGSTSLYGSEGANGVILITTKRAR